jgi:hypothetical protein
MNELNFNWIVIFKDNSTIEQLGKDGLDNHWAEVRDKFSDIAYFLLLNKDKSKVFMVDVLLGIIGFGKRQEEVFKFNKDKYNIRLIYYRKRDTLLAVGQQIEGIINTKHILGFQHNSNDGHNNKFILQIDDLTGNFLAGA